MKTIWRRLWFLLNIKGGKTAVYSWHQRSRRETFTGCRTERVSPFFFFHFFGWCSQVRAGADRQTYRLSGGLAGPAKPRCSFGDAASCRSAPLGVPSRAATSSGVKAGAVLLPPLPPSRATFGLVELGSSTSGGRTTWELRMEVLWDFYRDEADFKKKKMT